jgi:carbonic anhydrase
VSRSDLSRRSILRTGAAALGAGVLGAGVFGAAGPAAASPPTGDPVRTPVAALARLIAGNRRFTAGHARHPRQSLADLRRLASGQHPFCVMVGCADSRVPPEVLFDQGLGDVFDNRVAGNIVDDLLLASVEFAVEEFGSPLIVILGHERCGAVNATLEAIKTGATASGHLGDIVDALRPIVEPVLSRPGDVLDNAVRANIRDQAARLAGRSELIAERVVAGEVAIVGACYDLDDGRVALVD